MITFPAIWFLYALIAYWVVGSILWFLTTIGTNIFTSGRYPWWQIVKDYAWGAALWPLWLFNLLTGNM